MKKIILFTLLVVIQLSMFPQEQLRREQGNLVIENIPEIPA